MVGTIRVELSLLTKTSPNREKRLYRAEFLAQMPPAIHAMAAHRLASPRLEVTDEAVLFSNAEKHEARSKMLQRK